MRRQFRKVCTLVLLGLMTATGCAPSQPFYFREDGDLSHFIAHATDLEEADVEHERLAEVEHALPPLTISNSENFKLWDLTLEDCISIALQNSKVIKNIGAQTRNIDQRSQTSTLDALLFRPEGVTTIYDPAIFETDPQTGVEAALSDFDAQFSTQAFYQKTDRPQNINTVAFPFVPVVLQQDLAQVDIQMQKKTATGMIMTARSQTIYDNNNRGFGRNLPSDYFQALEAEAKMPLMRGRGVAINRLPVILSRMRTDVSLAEFEQAVRGLMRDLEFTYWDLNAQYRTLETAKIGRDSTLRSWRDTNVKLSEGNATVQEEAQAREQYFFFRSQVETALRDVYSTENQLRFLMGLAASDGRLIRPADEPSTARVDFDWGEIHSEALVRSADLRRQKWLIKQREIQLIAARNQLLPQFNVTALYRWLGLGDHYGLGQERNGINFPNAGSQAWDELTGGGYQEYRIGGEFIPAKVGARRELSGVRNAELAIARSRAQLEDMELNVSHTMASAIRDLDTQYLLAQTHFNRLGASEREVNAVETVYREGAAEAGKRPTLDLVLDAQRRRANAQVDYFRAVANYNKAIAEVHLRKGSILEYNGVQLAEGPWPKKAYWDALGHARERDAGIYLNYGHTRPKVMSRGPINQDMDGDDGTRGATPELFRGDGAPEVVEPQIDEPAPEPTPAPVADAGERLQPLTRQNVNLKGLSSNPLRGVRTAGYEDYADSSYESQASASVDQADQPAAGWKGTQR
jgi:outer membrane protein TolC